MSGRNEYLTDEQSNSNKKPLGRVQDYLSELKTCVSLIRELLIEIKELVVIVALIVFFIWGVIELLHKLH